MVPNGLKRYTIGDRTASLVYGLGGSLKICVQRQAPKDPSSNWLPAPEAGFYLIIRLYAPKTAVFEGGWIPPPIRKAL